MEGKGVTLLLPGGGGNKPLGPKPIPATNNSNTGAAYYKWKPTPCRNGFSRVSNATALLRKNTHNTH